MNPLSLLTKGRTIKGWKDRAAYKLPKGGVALPNFSASRPPGSPTSSHPHEEPKVSQPVLFDHPEPQPPTPAPARAATLAPAQKPIPDREGRAPRVPDIPSHDSSPEKPAPPRLPSRPGLWLRFSAWVCDLPHRWTARRKTSPFQVRTVQTELALDKVTVKRNDLSEEDLEIVPVGKKGKDKPPQQLAQHEQCQTISTNQ